MDNLFVSKEFIGIAAFIEEKCGIVLNEQNGHLIESRLSHLFTLTKVKNLEELYIKLCVLKDREALNHIIEMITINETFWFRDKSLWEMMERYVLPEFVLKLQQGRVKKITIWSAACSFGQEPYSMAMCIDNFLKKNAVEEISLDHFEITATDISMSALKIVERGQYDNVAINRGLDDHYRNRYFQLEGKLWRIGENIKNAVTSKPINLVEDSYHYNQYDLILCRNVLIYFSKTTKNQIYKKMVAALKDEGILLIGSSELLDDDQDWFSRECHEDGVYFKKKKVGDVIA